MYYFKYSNILVDNDIVIIGKNYHKSTNKIKEVLNKKYLTREYIIGDYSLDYVCGLDLKEINRECYNEIAFESY